LVIQALASAGAALSFFLLLVLAVKRPFYPADSWLAVWFLAQCVFCVCVLLGLAAPAHAALAALLVGQFALFVTWPAHYFYAASALGASPRPARHAALAAAVAVLVFALPILVPIRVEAGAMVTDIYTPWLLLLPLTGFGVASLYPLGVLRLVKRRRESLKDQLSEVSVSDPSWLQVWAWSILAVNVGLILAFANSLAAGWSVNVHMAVILTMQVAHIAYVGQRGLTRPGVFFAPITSVQASSQRQPVDRLMATEDYSQIQALLVNDKPHLLSNLTAEMLADRLGWGPERLTAALRHGGGVNFFDAINAARVREVQQLARKPANAHISLLVLAHEAGFGSKSAFYDAFRRHAGCTPAEWRRRQVDDKQSEVFG
jgi:AraC-like DNA-binding protein